MKASKQDGGRVVGTSPSSSAWRTRASPGHVMVLVGINQVRQSADPHDTRVAGSVSGAGSYRLGLILDARMEPARCALTLTCKAWCWVDADYAPVALGDLHTTTLPPRACHARQRSGPHVQRGYRQVVGHAHRRLRPASAPRRSPVKRRDRRSSSTITWP